MQRPTPQEFYSEFLEFVRQETQKERSAVSRRMFNVVLWCFLIPAFVAFVVILLVNFRILPHVMRGYLDWILLSFPIFYVINVLSSEVLKDLPLLLKKGGMTNTLNHAQKEGKWRERICEEMPKKIRADFLEWKWIQKNYKTDLDNLLSRIRFLTVLAGAVFFMIVKGIDSFFDVTKLTTNSDSSEWIGLSLFLLLFYLSGNQNYRSLLRFSDCVELIIQKEEG